MAGPLRRWGPCGCGRRAAPLGEEAPTREPIFEDQGPPTTLVLLWAHAVSETELLMRHLLGLSHEQQVSVTLFDRVRAHPLLWTLVATVVPMVFLGMVLHSLLGQGPRQVSQSVVGYDPSVNLDFVTAVERSVRVEWVYTTDALYVIQLAGGVWTLAAALYQLSPWDVHLTRVRNRMARVESPTPGHPTPAPHAGAHLSRVLPPNRGMALPDAAQRCAPPLEPHFE